VNAAIQLRDAVAADLSSINDIYNHYVLHSTCTYQEEVDSLDDRREWFSRHDEKHPVTVAEIDGRVVGWGSLSPYHSRAAYRGTVENSVYVHHELHRRGIGSAQLADLIVRAESLGHHTIIAAIDAEQAASVAMHAKLGFTQVGRFREVGYKLGKWLDVIYMQRVLDERS
jgi:L-amino acid N-acyltransferase